MWPKTEITVTVKKKNQHINIVLIIKYLINFSYLKYVKICRCTAIIIIFTDNIAWFSFTAYIVYMYGCKCTLSFFYFLKNMFTFRNYAGICKAIDSNILENIFNLEFAVLFNVLPVKEISHLCKPWSFVVGERFPKARATFFTISLLSFY